MPQKHKERKEIQRKHNFFKSLFKSFKLNETSFPRVSKPVEQIIFLKRAFREGQSIRIYRQFSIRSRDNLGLIIQIIRQ